MGAEWKDIHVCVERRTEVDPDESPTHTASTLASSSRLRFLLLTPPSRLSCQRVTIACLSDACCRPARRRPRAGAYRQQPMQLHQHRVSFPIIPSLFTYREGATAGHRTRPSTTTSLSWYGHRGTRKLPSASVGLGLPPRRPRRSIAGELVHGGNQPPMQVASRSPEWRLG